MQRKSLLITLVVMLSLMISVSVRASVNVQDNRSEEPAEEDFVFDEQDFEIKEYLYQDRYTNAGFIVIKNNSEKAVEVDITGTAYDSSGNSVSTGETSIDVIGPEEQSIATVQFYSDDEIDHVEYEYQYKKSDYEPVLSDISAEAFVYNENITVSATNNGEKPAQSLWGYVLYLDANNNLIAAEGHRFSDNKLELKPGAIYYYQFNYNFDYDHIECYFSGRFDGNPAEAQSDVSDKDFDIKEYSYSGGGYDKDFLIITNNSDKNVKITGNAGAIGSSGKIIGAADCEILILAPGETSIADFAFSDIDEGVDHVDYHLFYDTEPIYSPVIADLSAETRVNEENIEVSVTNNGTEAAKYVSAYVLYFDADGNVVNSNYQFFMDDDSELKPGATISEQFTKPDNFDHVEVYPSGKREKT